MAIPGTTASSPTQGREVAADLPGRDEINAYYAMGEGRLIGGLVERAVFTSDEKRRISEVARRLVEVVRAGAAAMAVSTPSSRSMAFPPKRASS